MNAPRSPTGLARWAPGLFALLAYALFGPSRVLVLGPDSSLVALVLAVVLPLSVGDPQWAIALAGMIAIVSGSLCVLAGTARLGFITELLSKPIRYGYMNGIALTVLINQLPMLFGFEVQAGGIFISSRAFVEAIWAGKTHWASLGLWAGTLLVILLFKRNKHLPAVLIAAVVIASAIALIEIADLRRIYRIQRWEFWLSVTCVANAELFKDRVLEAVNAAPTPVHWIVVGAEPMTSVDVTAADTLDELDAALNSAGIELCFAEMKDPVKDKLKRFGLFSRLDEERFFPTIGEAVNGYLRVHAVDWVDWVDREDQA